LIGRLLHGNGPDMSTEALEKFITSTPQGPHTFATILSQEAKRLLAMDRYERRALSRCKLLMRQTHPATAAGVVVHWRACLRPSSKLGGEVLVPRPSLTARTPSSRGRACLFFPGSRPTRVRLTIAPASAPFAHPSRGECADEEQKPDQSGEDRQDADAAHPGRLARAQLAVAEPVLRQYPLPSC